MTLTRGYSCSKFSWLSFFLILIMLIFSHTSLNLDGFQIFFLFNVHECRFSNVRFKKHPSDDKWKLLVQLEKEGFICLTKTVDFWKPPEKNGFVNVVSEEILYTLLLHVNEAMFIKYVNHKNRHNKKHKQYNKFRIHVFKGCIKENLLTFGKQEK